MKQKNIYLIILMIVAILIPISFVFNLSPYKSSQQNLELISAPNFSSVDVVSGEQISLSQYRGNVVLLNFVNYGCSQKTNEVVSKQLLAIKSLRDQRDDFIPVSVFCGCCPIETLRNFAVENDLSWPWLLDSDYSIIQEYNDYVRTHGYPTLVFINKDQYIVDFSGHNDELALSNNIDQMLD
jgi:peroxiredoxin